MSLHIHTYGRGPRLFVGLHGWSGDHASFAPLAAHMPEDATLLAVDLPGCGRSPKPARWDVEDVGETIARAVEDAGAAEATLIGNCSGAALALVAATRHRLRPMRIVLLDPFAYFPWYFRLFTLGEFGRRAYYSTFASSIGRRITDRSLRARRSSATSLTDSFNRVDHETTLRYLELLAQIEGPMSFAGLVAPIDIVVGERTFGAIRRSIPIWREVWPWATVHTLDDVGHLPIEESPGALARIVFGEIHELQRQNVT